MRVQSTHTSTRIHKSSLAFGAAMLWSVISSLTLVLTRWVLSQFVHYCSHPQIEKSIINPQGSNFTNAIFTVQYSCDLHWF